MPSFREQHGIQRREKILNKLSIQTLSRAAAHPSPASGAAESLAALPPYGSGVLLARGGQEERETTEPTKMKYGKNDEK